MSSSSLMRILRANRHALAAGLAVFGAFGLQSLTRTKIYEATAVCQVRHEGLIMSIGGARNSSPNQDDPSFADILKFALSDQLIQRVAASMDESQSRRLLSRRAGENGVPEKSLEEILAANHTAKPIRHSFLIATIHRDSDPVLAADLANLFNRELVQWSAAEGKRFGSVRRVDDAQPPAPGDYVSPNHVLDLALGLLAGLATAAAVAATSALIRRPRPTSK